MSIPSSASQYCNAAFLAKFALSLVIGLLVNLPEGDGTACARFVRQECSGRGEESPIIFKVFDEAQRLDAQKA